MRAVSVPGAEPSKPSAQRKNVRSRSRLSRNRRYDIENGRRNGNDAPQNRGSPSVADARMLSRTIRRGPGPRPQFLSGSRLFQVINPLLSLPVPRAQPQPSQPARRRSAVIPAPAAAPAGGRARERAGHATSAILQDHRICARAHVPANCPYCCANSKKRSVVVFEMVVPVPPVELLPASSLCACSCSICTNVATSSHPG